MRNVIFKNTFEYLITILILAIIFFTILISRHVKHIWLEMVFWSSILLYILISLYFRKTFLIIFLIVLIFILPGFHILPFDEDNIYKKDFEKYSNSSGDLYLSENFDKNSYILVRSKEMPGKKVLECYGSFYEIRPLYCEKIYEQIVRKLGK